MEPFPCTLPPVLNTSQWCPTPCLSRKQPPSIILSAEEICICLTCGGIARSHSLRTSKSGILADELTLNTSGILWHSGYLIRKVIAAQTKSSSPSRTLSQERV